MPKVFPISERITLPNEAVRDQIIRRVQTNDDPGISRDQLRYENPELGEPGVLRERLAVYFHDVHLFAGKYHQALSNAVESVVHLLGYQTRFLVPTPDERQDHPAADLVEFPVLLNENLAQNVEQDPDQTNLLFMKELFLSKSLFEKISEQIAEMERKSKEQRTKFLKALERLDRLKLEKETLAQSERSLAQEQRLQSIQTTILEIEAQLPVYTRREKEFQQKQTSLELLRDQLEIILQTGEQAQIRQMNANIARQLGVPADGMDLLLELVSVRNYIQLTIQPSTQAKKPGPVVRTRQSGTKKMGMLAATIALSAAAGFYGYTRSKAPQPEPTPHSESSRTAPQIADVPSAPWVQRPEYQEAFLTHFVSVALQKNRTHTMIMRAPGVPETQTDFSEEAIVAAAKRGGTYQVHQNGDATLITDIALLTLRAKAVETMLALWKVPESNIHFLHFYLASVMEKKVAATVTPKNKQQQDGPPSLPDILKSIQFNKGYHLQIDHKNGELQFENNLVRITVGTREFEKLYRLYQEELRASPDILSQEHVKPSPLHALRENSDLDFREFVVKKAVDAYAHPERKIVHPSFNYQKGSTLEKMQELFVLDVNPRELEKFLLSAELSQTTYMAYPGGVFQISLGDRGAILFEPGDAAVLMSLYKDHIAQLKKQGTFLLPLSSDTQLSEAVSFSRKGIDTTSGKK